jgi:hypothetical protein
MRSDLQWSLRPTPKFGPETWNHRYHIFRPKGGVILRHPFHPFSPANIFRTSLTLEMKLLTIYDVLKDQSFLIEVVSGDETRDALRAAVQERGFKSSLRKCSFKVGLPSGHHRLVFGNHALKSGRLPSRCLRNPFRYIDLVPYETRISRSFKVYIRVVSI